MKQCLEVKSKNIETAISQALGQLNVRKEEIEVEVLKEPVKGFLGLIGNKDGIFKITVKKDPVVSTENKQLELKKEHSVEKDEKCNEALKESDIVEDFILKIVKNLKIEAQVDVTQEKNTVKVNIKGKDAAILIGRRGETLDSIQFLAGLALNKIKKDSHFRVLIDIENYRSKREESLVKYARKVAREVAKTKKTKKLDYMNPYERRIIHSTLQNDKFVKTHSEGEDPYRRLVVEYKNNNSK